MITVGSVAHGAGMTTDGTLIYLLIGNGQNKLFSYDPAANEWASLENTPAKVTQGGALVYATDDEGEGFLFAFRGGAKDEFWQYEIEDDEWDDLEDAPGGVKWGGALTWDGADTIYAFRGGDTRDFWSYSIEEDEWTSEADAPGSVKEGGALVFVEGAVYAMRGGAEFDFWRFDVGVGNPAPGGTWDTAPADFPVTVGRGGAITSDGVDLIYALRGDDTKEIYRYQISDDAAGWIRGPDIPEQMREGGTLVFFGGDVYATQGRQTTEFLKISPLPPFP